MKIIAATAGLVLVVVALVLGIVGVATNSWAEASAGEIKFRLDLWKMCVKLPQLDAFNCSAIASTCKITSGPGPGRGFLFHRNKNGRNSTVANFELPYPAVPLFYVRLTHAHSVLVVVHAWPNLRFLSSASVTGNHLLTG